MFAVDDLEPVGQAGRRASREAALDGPRSRSRCASWDGEIRSSARAPRREGGVGAEVVEPVLLGGLGPGGRRGSCAWAPSLIWTTVRPNKRRGSVVVEHSRPRRRRVRSGARSRRSGWAAAGGDAPEQRRVPRLPVSGGTGTPKRRRSRGASLKPIITPRTEKLPRHLPQRAAGEAGLRVVVEPDGDVAATVDDRGPDGLGALAADRVGDDVDAPPAGVLHDASNTSSVVRSIAGSAPSSRHSPPFSGPPATAITRARRPRRAGYGRADRGGRADARAGSRRLEPPARAARGRTVWNGSRNAAASTSSSSGGASNAVAARARARPCRRTTSSRWRRPLPSQPGALALGLDDAAHVHAQRERRLVHHRATPPLQRAMSPKLIEAAATATRTLPGPAPAARRRAPRRPPPASPHRSTRTALMSPAAGP